MEPFNFSFFSDTGWGIDLDYCDIEWFAMEINRNHSVISETAPSTELPDVQAGFQKGRGTRDQIANIHWITEKAREFQKNIYFCFTDKLKPLTVWIITN